MDEQKEAVREFWDAAACGEDLYLKGVSAKADYAYQLAIRYQLEPYIRDFADFENWSGKQVLEIGVGLGADHQCFAEAGAILRGIDLTERAIEHVETRFRELGLESELQVGDVEALPFADNTFDLVYAWGVLHHTPNTFKSFQEVWRVLRPGGIAKIMIYQKYSMVGFMLWMRYGLLVGRPWRSLLDIYAHHMESPGTKAYTVEEARQLCASFSRCDIRTVLTHGDLLISEAGQRHRGMLLTLAKKIWPRSLIKRLFPGRGLFMLIEASK